MSDKNRISWQTLFAPTAILMDRLRYVFKFILIGVLVVLPLGFVFRSQFSIASERIEFNGKEVDGVDYIEPIRDMLRLVQRQRVMVTAAMVGDANFRALLGAQAGEIDRAVGRVDEAEARTAVYGARMRMGDVLKSTPRWNEAKNLWNAIKNTRYGTADDAEKAFGDLTTILNDIINNYAANYSNLILDPDLDSYWLMDAFIIKGPSIGEALSKAGSVGVRVPADAAAQTERFIELAGLYKQIGSTVSDLEAVNLATTFKEIPNFSKLDTTVKVLKPQMDDSKGVIVDANEILQKSYLNIGAGVKPPTLDDHHRVAIALLNAIDKNYLLHQRVGPELRTMCKMRADRYTAQRTAASIATIAAFFVLIYLFVGFYISVRRAVDTLRASTVRMISGTTDLFEVSAKDEMGEIAQSYNEINRALVEARQLKDKVESDNLSLQQDIVSMLEVVAQASDGDLTVRARVTEGSLGNVADAFNLLLESLQTLLSEVTKQIDRTNQSVDQISTASKDMESGATTQATEVKTATRVIEQISSESERVSKNALRAAEAARRTEESALEGAQVVEGVIEGMVRIRQTAQAGAKKVKSLGDRSMEITSIVGTISRISEQTNMLALNAAIEAARAGEYGRGFSVVAEEVRKLAERTAGATQEIDRLVKTIIAETNETVEVIEHQAVVVEEQSKSVSRAGESLSRIRQVSAESASLVSEITDVARAQVDGTTAVVQTVGQVSRIATATQKSAMDAVATIEDLILLSKQLSGSVSRFKVS